MKPGESSTAIYDDWAGDYEKDLTGEGGYIAHRIAVDGFVEACPDRRLSIIDLCCGTGLVGKALADLGYTTIDGLDISSKMLVEARKKGVYERLFQGDLTDRTAIADAVYDAVLCVGAFAAGHLGPKNLGELIRVAKPGATIVLFMNGTPYAEDDYPSHFRRLEKAGLWRVERTKCSNYIREIDRPDCGHPGWLVVGRRMGG